MAVESSISRQMSRVAVGMEFQFPFTSHSHGFSVGIPMGFPYGHGYSHRIPIWELPQDFHESSHRIPKGLQGGNSLCRGFVSHYHPYADKMGISIPTETLPAGGRAVVYIVVGNSHRITTIPIPIPFPSLSHSYGNSHSHGNPAKCPLTNFQTLTHQISLFAIFTHFEQPLTTKLKNNLFCAISDFFPSLKISSKFYAEKLFMLNFVVEHRHLM